jgi:hypothetical protein
MRRRQELLSQNKELYAPLDRNELKEHGRRHDQLQREYEARRKREAIERKVEY